MFPFKIPIAQLQALRERVFYCACLRAGRRSLALVILCPFPPAGRVVYWYRLSLQLDLLNRK